LVICRKTEDIEGDEESKTHLIISFLANKDDNVHENCLQTFLIDKNKIFPSEEASNSLVKWCGYIKC
jgi:hypothetical protein